MIRDLTDPANTVISINLKDGRYFEECDLTSDPFGVPGFVAFWVGETILVIPLSTVVSMTMQVGV